MPSAVDEAPRDPGVVDERRGIPDSATLEAAPPDPSKFSLRDAHPEPPALSAAVLETVRKDSRQTAFLLCLIAAAFLAVAWWLLLFTLEEYLPAVCRSLMAVTLLGVCQMGAWAAYRRDQRRWMELLLFLDCLLFGVAIIVVLTHNPPSNLMLDVVRFNRLFLLGVFCLALAADSTLVYLAYALVLAFCGWYEILASAFTNGFVIWHPLHLLWLGVIPGFVWGYRRNSPLVVGANVILLGAWLMVEPVHCDLEEYVFFAPACLGITLLFIAQWHAADSPQAEAWRLPGLAVVSAPLFFLGHVEIWRGLGFGIREGRIPTVTADRMLPRMVCEAFLSLSLLVGFLILFRLYKRRRLEGQSPRDAAAALARQFWLPLGLLLLVGFDTLWYCSPPMWLPWGTLPLLVSHAGSVLLAAYVLDAGVRLRRGSYVAAGLLLAGRVAYLTALLADVNESRIGMTCLTAFWAVTFLGLALAWVKSQPSRPDPLVLAPRTYSLPARVERWIDYGARRQSALLLTAFLVQHAAIAVLGIIIALS